MLEHGGGLRRMAQQYARPLSGWLDLSTGISPRMYCVPELPAQIWQRLPEYDPALMAAAQAYYGASTLLAVAGSQAAIAALPRLRRELHGPQVSRVLLAAPSYAEHQHHWRMQGHEVHLASYAELDRYMAATSFDVLVLVNPNNPTGERVAAEKILAWSKQLSARGGWLVVDEAFADTQADAVNSVLGEAASINGLIVLRAVGKFFGLAGVRLGFVAAHSALLQALENALGPWTISTAAQIIGRAALEDVFWQAEQKQFLQQASHRLLDLLQSQRLPSQGTELFQWCALTPEVAGRMHQFFAERGIFLRLFTDAAAGIRFGLPADEAQWQRLADTLHAWRRHE